MAAPKVIGIEQPAEHVCEYAPFILPCEPAGRTFQCVHCKAIGFKRVRFKGGRGQVVHYTCSKPKCEGIARSRIPGRGPRGAYIWACSAHSLVVNAAP